MARKHKKQFINKKLVAVPRVELIINKISNGEDYYRDLHIFKIRSSIEKYNEGILDIFRNTDIRSKLIGTDFAESVSNLFTGKAWQIGPLDRELLWSSCELFMYRDRINEFIKLKTNFEASLLKGEYDNAQAFLTNIELTYGQSFWLIENKMAIMGYCHNHEALRAYEEELVSKAKNNPILVGMIKNLVHKSRIESSNSLLGKFTNTLIRTVEELGHRQALDYFKFKLDHYNYFGTNYSAIIAWERHMPIIDRYETLVRVCQRLCVEGERYELKSVAKVLATLTNKINDMRLENMLVMLNANPKIPSVDDKPYIAIENYINGKYADACKVLGSELLDGHPCYNLWEMYAKTKILAGDTVCTNNEMYMQIINSMINVLTMSKNMEDSVKHLKDVRRSFASLGFTTVINEFLYNNYEYCEENLHSFSKKISDLNSSVITARVACRSNSISVRENVKRLCPISYRLIMATIERDHQAVEQLHVPLQRKNKDLCSIYFEKGWYEQSIKCATDIRNFGHGIYKVYALRTIVKALHESKKYTECIGAMVNAILENQSFIHALPTEMILCEIESGHIKVDDDNLKTLILYDCYSKTISSSRNDKIADMFDRFIDINGYESPVEILKHNKYPKAEVLYFMKYICITENLDVLDVYNSVDDVYTERVKICELLKFHDPENRTEYDSMIDEIITRMVLESAMAKVGGGRIFIDIEGIKRTIRSSFGKSYSSIKAELPIGNNIANESFCKYSDETGDIVVYPESSYGRRLFSLYKELYKEVKENTEYGIDCSLGTDIRHGHLSNQIRPILDRYQLIFQKGSDGKYTSNKYWHDKYSVISLDLAKKVDRALAELSRLIDGLVEEMKSEWFNIGGKKFPLLHLSSDKFVEMQELFVENNEQEDYLSYLIGVILETTDTTLGTLRKDFNHYYPNSIDIIFNNIIDIIENDAEAVRGLIEQLNLCRNELLKSGDEISSWIAFSSNIDPPDFQLTIPIAHSIDVFKKLYMHKNIEYVTNVNCDYNVNGKYLRSFIRIFIILIENAIKHSKLSSLKIYLEVSTVQNNIVVTAANELGSSVDKMYLKNTCNEILDSIKNQRYLDNSTKDKTSGIYKVARILRSNLGCIPDIDITLENNMFEIRLCVPVKGILK